MIFHNGLSYDYHFNMKELAKEFDGEFSCLGENPKTYTTFSALITNKVKRIDKKWERNYKKISYK